jgi:hypothetical protein
MKSASIWACCAIVMVSLGAALTGQDKPDFSGSWVLESSVSAVDIPQTMSVSQSIRRTNVRGEPMTPHFNEITITRGPRSGTFRIGLLGGTVSGSRHTHQGVVWAEQALVFEDGSYTGLVAGSGDWEERREVWALDSSGRLRVAITTSGSASAPAAVTLVYRRQ